MEGIDKIDITHMNNGAHFIYMSNILERAEETETISSKMGDQIAALKSALATENLYLKVSQKSLLTDEITVADADRGKYYNSFKQTIKGLMKSPDPVVAKSAKVINQNLIDYALNPKMQLDKQTGLLVNMVEDWEGKLANDITNTHTEAYVAAIKKANEEVRTLMSQRTDERKKIPVSALKTARKGTDAAYRNLIKYTNAHILLEGLTDYEDFISFINKEIERYKQEVLKQKTSGTKKPGSTTPPVSDKPVDDDDKEEENGQPSVSDDEEEGLPPVQ